MSAQHITQNDFENEVLKSDKAVLVDFFADWCNPCQRMGPIVDKVSENVQNVKFCKINIDDCPDLVEKYDVMSIPNFKLFKNGQLVAEELGAIGEEGLLNLVNRAN